MTTTDLATSRQLNAVWEHLDARIVACPCTTLPHRYALCPSCASLATVAGAILDTIVALWRDREEDPHA